MNNYLTNPELSFGLSLPTNLPLNPSLNTKFPISWKMALAIFAIWLMLYWTGNLENQDTKQKS